MKLGFVFGPLALGAAAGCATTLLTAYWFFGEGVKDSKLEPKIGGMNAQTALIAGGLGMAFLIPALTPVGIGLAIGGLIGSQNLKTVKEGLDRMIAAQAAKQLAADGVVDAEFAPLPEPPPDPPTSPLDDD